MALTNKLTAIANAIRSKTGKTDALSLDAMVTEIEELTSEQTLKALDYPDYVRTEAVRVANEVRSVLKSDSFVSICLSDSHFPADNNTRASAIHAMMATKALSYLIPVDFIAHLGDVGFEGNSSTTTTIDLLETNLREMLGYIKESAGDSVPLFVAIGNHDSGNYITTSDNSDMLSGEYLYNNFTALSASDNTVFSGQANGGYCYRDFPEKKMRVFLLNTSEEIITGGYTNDNGTSETQRSWVASKLQELNTKSDAADWGIIVLCHYPADYGAARPLSNLFAAYVNGTSITLKGVTFNFSNSNAAKFIVQHHGHIHNFLADKLYTGNTPTQYEAWRVGIPNTQDSRENYYGTFNGIQYSENVSYTKVPNTAQDTSFVVNVINPSEEKIYSFYYGKGYNREISYKGVTYYSITSNLTYMTNSNNTTRVEEGASYTATISLGGTDYTIVEAIKVTMGGTDITSSALSGMTINIPNVTGNIVISGVAKAPPTNLLPLAVDADGVTIYNGIGYKTGVRISTSDGGERTNAGMAASGWIPWNASSEVLVLENVGRGTSNYTDSMVIGYAAPSTSFQGSVSGDLNLVTEITPEADGTILLTADKINAASMKPAVTKYIRISSTHIGADTKVYVKE